MRQVFSGDALTDFRSMLRYGSLGDEPPEFDLVRNDAKHRARGAHTLDRHGPGIPLQRMAGAMSIEGRIYGDPPWSRRVTRSYQWTDLAILDGAVNAYVRRNWAAIRIDLANRCRHDGVADAGRVVGRGYESSGTKDAGRARYREVSQFRVCIRLISKLGTAVPFILTTYPWSSSSGQDGSAQF
jgi:hypothetical protein